MNVAHIERARLELTRMARKAIRQHKARRWIYAAMVGTTELAKRVKRK